MRVCQNSFSAKDSYHFVKNNRYQRVNNSMITVTLIFMRGGETVNMKGSFSEFLVLTHPRAVTSF